MNKEERRRQEALRKQKRTKLVKGAVVSSLVVLTPILFYLVLKS